MKYTIRNKQETATSDGKRYAFTLNATNDQYYDSTLVVDRATFQAHQVGDVLSIKIEMAA